MHDRPVAFSGLTRRSKDPYGDVREDALCWLQSAAAMVERIRRECGEVSDAFFIGRLGMTLKDTALTWFHRRTPEQLATLPAFTEAFVDEMFADDIRELQEERLAALRVHRGGGASALLCYLLASARSCYARCAFSVTSWTGSAFPLTPTRSSSYTKCPLRRRCRMYVACSA